MRETRITECKPTQSGTQLAGGRCCPNKIRAVESLPWHVKTFWHLQLKEFHSPVKKLRKCYSCKLSNWGVFGDASNAKDTIKRTIQRGRLNGTKCREGSNVVTDEQDQRRSARCCGDSSNLFPIKASWLRFSREMFPDKVNVYNNCIKIFRNLFTIIIGVSSFYEMTLKRAIFTGLHTKSLTQL